MHFKISFTVNTSSHINVLINRSPSLPNPHKDRCRQCLAITVDCSCCLAITVDCSCCAPHSKFRTVLRVAGVFGGRFGAWNSRHNSVRSSISLSPFFHLAYQPYLASLSLVHWISTWLLQC